MKTDCLCQSETNLVEISNNYSDFIAKFVEVALGNWVKLVECPRCGQLWIVDFWDKYQTVYAVKIASKSDWEQFDSKALIKARMIENRGGLTDEKCMWAKCDNRQLKSSAFCVDHLFESGARS
jgi:hypothetical protein